MNFEYNGLLGVLIFLVTVAALVVAALIALAVFIFGTRGSQRKTGARWSKYFLLSGIIFLLFDGMFYVMEFSGSGRTISSERGKALDWWMFYVWIPAHLIGYFLIAVALRYVFSRKENQLINE